MKRWMIILLALALPVAGVLAQDTLQVAGTVVNGADGNVLPLCRVQLLQGKIIAEAYSDYAGNYKMKNVPPGSYTFLVTQFGDTLMCYHGLSLERDTWVRSVVMPPSEDELSDVPQYVSMGMKNLRPVLIYSHRHSLLAKMGLLINDPNDPRLWNFSGQMDPFEELELSFWWNRYKLFYKLKAMGYQISSPFELVYPEVYHPAADSAAADYRIWVMGLKF